MESPNKYKKTMIAIHIAVWLIIFLAPLTFFEHWENFNVEMLVPCFSSPIFLAVVFYTTYFHLTPKYFIGGEKRKFWLYAALLVIVAGVLLHVWLSMGHSLFAHEAHRPQERHRDPRAAMELVFMFRNTFNMVVAAAIATMSYLAVRWHESETARHEAEMARADAELKNLRNQINPHFLLNTLNNIYALTAFNQQKAQQAILELSAMLRHILYDNQMESVNLADEVKFMYSYINLMKIRIPQSASINVNVSIPKPCNVYIAPLIFISLIENAFKHGISTTAKSFINIDILASDKEITCCIENSNHPKQETDRSGHGIGLEQVSKRLELSYKGKYSWENGLKDNNNIYYSKITIYDTKLRNN